MIPVAGEAHAPDRSWGAARLHPVTRLLALPLALGTCLAAPVAALPLLLIVTAVALRRTGLPWRAQAAAARAWWPVALVVLIVHTLTRVSAAPLGHPSLAGLARGVETLARVACTVGAVALWIRLLPLADLVAALGWCGLALLRRRLDTTALSLVVATAVGTVPAAVAEGRRIDAALRLRRGGADRVASGPVAGALRRPARWWRRVFDRAHLTLPLLEGLFRRAEALTLALRWRLPRPALLRRPPLAELAGLVLWTALLVVTMVLG